MSRVRVRHIAGLGKFLAALVLASPPGAWTQQTPSISPVEMIRRAVNGERQAQQESTHKFLFLDRKQTPHGSQTRVLVETADAIAAMTIAYDDKPLNPEQRRSEMERLRRLADSPEELRRKHKQELDDAERVGRIVKALPDAFLYDYAGSESGNANMGAPGGQLSRLNFRPNPDYDPPSHVEQVLVGMQGYVLVDPEKNRIARIDGTLAKDVGFGWGILGHLDRGGRFVVEQREISPGAWEISRMELRFTGKILLFKSINIQSTEIFTDFQPVPPDLKFSQAIDLLARQEATFAENTGQPNQSK